MHVVLINGPAGAGKNTLALKMKTEMQLRLNNQYALRKLLKRNVSSIAIEEHKQPLIHMLFAFAASLSAIDYTYDVYNSTAYERLKQLTMLGRTGRAWQIIWADAMRASDSHVFVDGLHSKLQTIDPDVAIIPDCGFADEYQRAVERFGSDNVTLLYLDGWKSNVPIYKQYDRFADDIRICLRDNASLSNPTAPQAVSYVFGRMEENAKQQSLF